MAQPKPYLKSQQGQRTHRLLLDAALSLFALKGYGATSVEDICERASLSKGGFYFHFEGKEALLVEALEGYANPPLLEMDFWRVTEEDDTSWRPALHESGSGPNAAISAALQLELWAQALRQEQVRNHLRRSRTRLAALLRRRLRLRLTTRGAADAEALAREIVALRDGLTVQSLLLHDKPMERRLDALAATIARHALDGEPSDRGEAGGAQKRPA